MRITETQQLFEQAAEYPMDATTVTDRFGDVEVEAPTGETTTVSAVLARLDARTYTSADELYTVLVGNLDESFIGRKYYDDRGDMLPDPNRDDMAK